MIKKEDPKLVYYGPHPCQRCDKDGKKGTRIVKAGNGAPADLEFDYPQKEAEKIPMTGYPYPNNCSELPWNRHECPHEDAPHRATAVVRKDIYAEFEKLVGRKMTDEEHAKIKKLIVEYVDIYKNEIAKAMLKIEKLTSPKKK